jgi:uncharacterized protein (DUF2249 family)
MIAHSEQVVLEFCKLCSWTHEVWQMHRTFESQLAQLTEQARTRHAYLFERLSIVSQEYTLLQITKLHDPSVQQRSVNLSLAYIVEYGAWDAETLAELLRLKARLDDLGRATLSAARNKLLCHSDLAAILAGDALGSFATGIDDDYFDALKAFTNIVHDRVIGGPFIFGDEAESDVRDLVTALNASQP